jgi:hypothetical protein
VSRSSKGVRGKRKVETKKARVKRRAMPERMRSGRPVAEVTYRAGNGTNASRDNAGPLAGEAVVLATNAIPKMNDQSGRSDLPTATATALAVLQAWFLWPLRNLQSWQEAWFRLLPR